jgi:hypothetical protein
LFRAKKKGQTKNKKIKKRDWLKTTTLLTENFRLVDVLLLLKKKLFLLVFFSGSIVCSFVYECLMGTSLSPL